MAKIHAVCVPLPAQGHITPMLNFAKLLNNNGVHITFFNSEINHKRLLNSNGPNSLDGTSSFKFDTFSDGLPENRGDVTQSFPALVQSLVINAKEFFVNILRKVSDPSSGRPPVTLMIFDCVVPFAPVAARVAPQIPLVFFWAAGACSYLGFGQYKPLLEKGIVPFEDPDFMTNGSLEKTVIDWVPSMKDVRLKDLPSIIRTTNSDDPLLNYVVAVTEWCRGSPMVVNTFDALEHESLEDISKTLVNGPLYSIGPLHTFVKGMPNNEVASLGSNLWKNDSKCSQWLDSKEPNSVVYVSFGSVAIKTNEELNEFAWGLANSNYTFLWVLRKNIVTGGVSAELSPEVLKRIKGKGLIVDWCDQQMVLNHPAIGVFMTHCGWNSTLEAIASGVPVICWPYFTDQTTNSFYCCNRWGNGVEIDSNANRDGVANLLREVMEGEKGKSMKKKAIEWKKLAEDAISSNGSSYNDFNKFINYVLSLGQK